MEYKQLGNKKVNPIGIGTWLMGGGVYVESKTTFAVYDHDEEAIAAIRYSIEKGQNHIDTAQMYGAGHTEEVVGQAIRGYDRNSLFIASKLWKSHATRSAVSHAVVQMLERLSIDKLDLVYAHAPWPEVNMEEYIVGLNDAVDQGLTDYIGVSNFNLDQLKQAVNLSKHPIAALQNHFNVLYKQEIPQELEDFCKDNAIAVVAYRPLGRKLLTDECTSQVILDLAKKYEKTPGQIALRWLTQKPNFHAIPKAVEPHHIDENIEALSFELSVEDTVKLSALADEKQK